jgi:hypothetical protein
MTRVQRETLIRMEKSQYGDLHFGGRTLLTAWALVSQGYISGGFNGWYSITQRGRNYIRFQMRRRDAKGEASDEFQNGG